MDWPKKTNDNAPHPNQPGRQGDTSSEQRSRAKEGETGQQPLFQPPAINLPKGGGACDWEMLSATITPNSSTLNIKILLEGTPLGDGNDLAIDAIGLHETPPLAQTYRDFTYVILTMDATTQTYTLQVTPVAPLPDGWGYFWEVCELNCSSTSCAGCNSGDCVPGTKVSSPSQWWTGSTTDFAGYNGTSTLSGTAAGVFEYGKR